MCYGIYLCLINKTVYGQQLSIYHEVSAPCVRKTAQDQRYCVTLFFLQPEIYFTALLTYIHIYGHTIH